MMLERTDRRDIFDRRTVDEYIVALGSWVKDRIAAGWSPYMLTLMFNDLPRVPLPTVGGDVGGPADLAPATYLTKRVMFDAADRVYRTFLTAAVRRPRWRAADSLPLLICAPDLPVSKRSKGRRPNVVVNHGLHMHGVLIVPPQTRLTTTTDAHFKDRKALYVRGAVSEIDVRPITRTPERVMDYVLKAVRHRRIAPGDRSPLSLDDVLILPRARAELRNAIAAVTTRSKFWTGSEFRGPTKTITSSASA